MKKIAIRADGGSNIGMGHIMRTLVLARELSKNNDVFYICEDLDEYKVGRDEISKYFDVINVSLRDNYDELVKVDADILITDSYNVDKEYFKITKKHFNVCGYIDDMNLYDFCDLDFVINQNYNAQKLNYIGSKETKFLCGSNYTMLREEFRDSNKIKINKKINRIGISMGGADVANVTPKVLEYLGGFKGEIDVIVTKNFENLNHIYDSARLHKNFHIHLSPIVSNVLTKVDLLISAAGSTLYEACSVGVPTLAVIVADNQIELSDNMDNDGLIMSMGWYNNLDESKFLSYMSAVENYNKRMKIQLKQESVNTHGVFNIVKKLECYV